MEDTTADDRRKGATKTPKGAGYTTRIDVKKNLTTALLEQQVDQAQANLAVCAAADGQPGGMITAVELFLYHHRICMQQLLSLHCTITQLAAQQLHLSRLCSTTVGPYQRAPQASRSQISPYPVPTVACYCNDSS